MSAMKYALNPASHAGPDSMPRYGGKITFPAPEEHGKQGKANNDDIAAGPVFRFFHDFLSFDFPKGDSRFLFSNIAYHFY